MDISCKWNHTMCGPFGRPFTEHSAPGTSVWWQVAGPRSSAWLSYSPRWVQHIVPIQSTDGHLYCFHLLTVMINAIIDIRV